MTNPRPMPNNAMADIATTAEQLNAIIRTMRRLQRRVMNGEATKIDLLYMASEVLDRAQTGVRCLERHGAPTLPVAREDEHG